MKKTSLLIFMTLLLALTSCSDWLDVEPKAELKLDVMLETEQGFKDALIGCYIMLSESSLYGAELTCTFLDVLGQQYNMPGSTQNPYEESSLYIYTNTKAEESINGIWSKMYNVLANVNALIEALENNKSKLNPSIHAMIKAEAYSLRAFIYTDLVRLFTWGNLSERSDKLEELSIPYAKVYHKDIVQQSKLGDVLKYIHEDLEIALELFEAYDPQSLSDNRPEGYDLPDEDKFYDKENKKYRMNLLAAYATRMRLNMWEGNYTAAYEDAKTLTNPAFSIYWANRFDVEPKERDLTFSTEMIFGLKTHERFDKVVAEYFYPFTDNWSMNPSVLLLSKSRVDELYEIGSGVGASDWRYTRLWDKSNEYYVFLKFWEYEDMRNTNNISLIKWPEVFYTLAECLLRQGGGANKNLAIGHLNTIRNKRNIPASENLSYSLSEAEVGTELYKEWRKEYIGDGQMFYFYKRNGFTSIPYGPAVAYDDNVYVLPLPQLEVDFGGREELVKE